MEKRSGKTLVIIIKPVEWMKSIHDRETFSPCFEKSSSHRERESLVRGLSGVSITWITP